MCKHCRWFQISGLLVLHLRIMGCPCYICTLCPTIKHSLTLKSSGFHNGWCSVMDFKVFNLCRMARLFGRFGATVWFRCLCWNKGMLLHGAKTQKRPFYSTAEKSSNKIFSLYKSTWHVSLTHSYHLRSVLTMVYDSWTDWLYGILA